MIGHLFTSFMPHHIPIARRKKTERCQNSFCSGHFAPNSVWYTACRSSWTTFMLRPAVSCFTSLDCSCVTWDETHFCCRVRFSSPRSDERFFWNALYHVALIGLDQLLAAFIKAPRLLQNSRSIIHARASANRSCCLCPRAQLAALPCRSSRTYIGQALRHDEQQQFTSSHHHCSYTTTPPSPASNRHSGRPPQSIPAPYWTG